MLTEDRASRSWRQGSISETLEALAAAMTRHELPAVRFVEREGNRVRAPVAFVLCSQRAAEPPELLQLIEAFVPPTRVIGVLRLAETVAYNFSDLSRSQLRYLCF